MNQIALKGSAGEVRWSYHRAASLGSWTLEGRALSASIAEQDAFRLSQQPLVFVVPRPNGHAWSWPITAVRVDGTTLYAELDTKERSV
jgi:hypothetical protein